MKLYLRFFQSALVLVLAAHVATAATPLPAPNLYITGNHGVKFDVPAGLYYCPLPDGWVGVDRGTTLYLVRPDSCITERSPRLVVYYEYNVTEYDHGDGIQRPPSTPAELLRDRCKAQLRTLPGLTLLGHPAKLCVEQSNGMITATALALYDLEHSNAYAGAPDSILGVTLSTTPGRYNTDIPVFRRVLEDIAICVPNWAKPKAGREA